jgi:glucose-1-phosphate cytidylyltransferase
MQVVILAGGIGSRLSEETHSKPKPMVEIGGRPILWHIMKYYSYYGFNDFIICGGYKSFMIKDYFINYAQHSADIEIDLIAKKIKLINNNKQEQWKIKIIDTGELTQTGGRIKKILKYINQENFLLTYGDGLSNININELINFHKNSNFDATISAVQPPGRFGSLILGDKNVSSFIEKPDGDGTYINGGFAIVNKSVSNYLTDDNCIWETDALVKMTNNSKLGAYKHNGFWQCMDTIRDKNYLESLWLKGQCPWKIW